MHETKYNTDAIPIQSRKNLGIIFYKDRSAKIICIFSLVILGLTTTDKALISRSTRGDKICIYDERENETFSRTTCVYWNTTKFILAYDPISMKDTVIQWLKTELRVEKLAVSSYFPAIEFHTNSQHGIYGFYVWDRIMNQKVFTVLFLQESPQISTATPPLD